MGPTTGWLPGRNANHWFVWCATIGMMLLTGHWATLSMILLGLYFFMDFRKDRQRFFSNSELYRLIASGILLSTAWSNPIGTISGVVAASIIVSILRKGSFLNSVVAEFFELRTMRFCCLLIAICIVRHCAIGLLESDGSSWIPPISPTHVVVSMILSLLAVPVMFASAVFLRETIAHWKFRNSSRFFRTLWHTLTFNGFILAQLIFILIATTAPGSPGDWIVGWLVSAGRDANLVWSLPSQFNPFSFQSSIGNVNRGLEQVVSVSSINVGLFLESLMAIVCSIAFMPKMLSISAFLTSVARRFRTDVTVQSFVEDFLEVLKQPASKLRIKEAIPWLHNTSATFFWFLFCYALLFYSVCGLPGPLGESVIHWLDFTFTDVGFAPHSVDRYPQLRMFFASLVAMMGAVPLAVTGCAFLPTMTAKYISVTSDGILLPKGPYLSLWFRPFRSWSDMKSVTIKGRVGETKLNKRTLVISFFSGGCLKLKLHQLSQKDLYDLFSAIDEYADECFIAPEVLELRRFMSETNGAKILPEEGQLRSLPADNFRSTVFVPYSVGESIPNTTMRIVRQLGAKQLSAVYLVRLADGRLAVAKQFCFPEDSAEAERMRKIFLREYELLSQLEHPRTARVLECFEQGNSSILVLEYARGRDLREIVERDGARNEKFVVDIAIQLCEVMRYLHDRSPAVLHRDLTPDNLVIDEDRNVKLIDFGAAHQFLEGITGTLIGKQCYVAPEQLRGEPTTKSDIYSFGCTLYFLLTGEDPVALSQCDPKEHATVSPSVRKLVMQCTEFDEKGRPNSFREIARTLYEISEGSCSNREEEDPGFRIKMPGENVMATAPSKSGEQG